MFFNGKYDVKILVFNRQNVEVNNNQSLFYGGDGMINIVVRRSLLSQTVDYSGKARQNHKGQSGHVS